MRQTGKVVDVNGDMATIRFVRSGACKNCGACLYIGEKEAETEVRNSLNASVGDNVSLELHAKSFLQASLLAYVLPLVLMLAGLFIGTRFSEIMGVILALAFAGGAYLILRALEPRFSKSMKFKPRMIDFSKEEGTENNCGGRDNG